MGHEHERDADLRAGEHRRGGRGLQQPAVGRREEEPGGLSTVYLPSTHLSTYLQVDFYSDRYVGTNLDNPSFAEISRAMGGEGVTVTRPEEVLILFPRGAHLA